MKANRKNHKKMIRADLKGLKIKPKKHLEEAGKMAEKNLMLGEEEMLHRLEIQDQRPLKGMSREVVETHRRVKDKIPNQVLSLQEIAKLGKRTGKIVSLGLLYL
nr:hypothetical protein [Mycoplasma haemofelis]